MNKIADLIIKYKIPILVFLTLGTLFFVWQLPNLEFDFSVENMMLENDPDVKLIKDTFDEFGSDEISFLAIKMPPGTHVFQRENLNVLRELSNKIEKLDKVDEATSIFSVKVITQTEDGFDVDPLIDKMPETEAEEEALRKRALGDLPIVGAMINEKADTVLVIVRYDYDPADYEGRVKAVKKLRELLAGILPSTMEWHLAGLTTGGQVMHDLGILNAKIFTPITIVLISIFLLFIFRSTYGLLLPQITTIMGGIWTVGLMVLFGMKFNMATTMIPSLIIAYSFSDIIHLFTHYFHEISNGVEKKQAIKKMIRKLIVPCFLSSFTTAVGFSSLIISDLRPIRVFGIFSATGVMLVFFIALTLAPILLYYTPPPSRDFLKSHTRGKTYRLLEIIAGIVQRRPLSVLIVFAILLVVGAYGISMLKVETNLIEYFKKDNEIVVAKDFIQEHLTGTTPIDVVIVLPENGSIKDPNVLKRLDRTVQFFKDQPEIRHVSSIADLIKEINKVMHDGDESEYRIPDSRELIAQYLLLFSVAGSEELSRLVDSKYRTARILVRAQYMISAELKTLIERMNDHLSKQYGGKELGRVTGTASLFVKMVDYLIESQAKSLGLAFLMIFITMTVLFRSLKIGALAMIPNFFPIVMILGVMGWLGINLDVVTAMVASVALGIAVDDTIHFLVRFRGELEDSDDYSRVMINTLTTTGKAMSFTTLTICSGFGVLMLSLINPPAYFGLLTCISLFFALISDIFIMPAIMVLLHPKMRL